MDLITQDDSKLLLALQNVKASIAEIDDISALQQLSAQASGFEKAWHKYYKSSGFGFEQMFGGWEIKVRSERKMGEILPTLLKVGESHEVTFLDDLGISKSQSHRYQQLARINADIFEKKIEEFRNSFLEPTTSGLLKPHISNNSGENEWYTPKNYIDAAKQVMGSIDLDPASSAKANEIVQANKYYSKDDNGLTQEWAGNIWLNPPYSQPLISDFSKTIVDKFLKREITQACILVNNATDTNWFQRMLNVASAVCFIKGRVKFIDLQGESSGAPLQGQAILYFGENLKGFNEAYKKFGVILWTSNGE